MIVTTTFFIKSEKFVKWEKKVVKHIKTKMIAAIMMTLFLTSIMAIMVPVKADTGRFAGMTYLYRVETQSDVDALPSIIDATGYDIAILVEGSDLMIEDFTISGAKWYCVAVDGQHNVTVSNCTVIGSFVAIYYYASSGTISNNTVYGYVKNGITANLPSSDGASVDIFWNTVIGRGPVGLGDWAQNGIQIGFGATGNVQKNYVSDHWYTAADWAACGILIFESDNCMVHGNVLENNQVGIGIETWCWYLPSASGNKVVKNEIRSGQVGVSVAAFAWKYSTGDSFADNNKVVNNVIEDQDVGVSVGAWYIGGDYAAYADNNKVIRNSFSEVSDPIQDEGTATKIHANVFW